MGRVEALNRHLKAFDYKLYAAKNKEGTLCIYRRSKRCEPYDIDGVLVNFIRPAPHFIFALTTDWKAKSPSREWGIEPIMQRLKMIDLWNRDVALELEQQHERAAQATERDAMREHDAFVRQELRPVMKKEFSTVLTHSLDKTRYRKVMEKCR